MLPFFAFYNFYIYFLFISLFLFLFSGGMVLDNLTLTSKYMINTDIVKSAGNWYIKDSSESLSCDFYRYMADNGLMKLFWYPDRFGPETTAAIAQSRIHFNPKRFVSFEDAYFVINRLFSPSIAMSSLSVSGVDCCADFPGIDVGSVINRLRVAGMRQDSYRYEFNSTIYVGSRGGRTSWKIYDKKKEILFRQKKGKELSPYDLAVLATPGFVCRFEVTLRQLKITLNNLHSFLPILANEFDNLQLFGEHGAPWALSYLWPMLSRSNRDKLLNEHLLPINSVLKDKFLEGAYAWLQPF
jgi:hypothetical protein